MLDETAGEESAAVAARRLIVIRHALSLLGLRVRRVADRDRLLQAEPSHETGQLDLARPVTAPFEACETCHEPRGLAETLGPSDRYLVPLARLRDRDETLDDLR